jgi:hypothetical protein
MKTTSYYLVAGILSLYLFLIALTIHAANYYIDQNHPSANDQNIGTIDQPWETMEKANRILIAGDTVFIKSGTYNSYISPDNSGTANSLITFKNYRSDKVVISDAIYGIHLNAKSHISVHGINFQNLDRFVCLQNGANFNVIAYCSFDQARMINGKTSTWAGSSISKNSKYNWVHHCQFSKYGYFTDDDISVVLDIGNEEVTDDFTSHNLIEDCTFFHGGHHILGVYGMYNVIRNNYLHNEAWSMGTPDSDRGVVLYGDRNLSIAGNSINSGRNLFEGNQIAYSADPSDNRGSSGMSLNTSYNIVRFNRFYHNDCRGISMSLTRSYLQDIVYNKIYNNTFFNNRTNTEGLPNCGILFALYSGKHVIEHNAIKNNILFAHQVPYKLEKVNPDSQIFSGNWNGDAEGDPMFINASMTPGDPMDSRLPDLRLKPESPCRDKGTYLTTITSADGSGRAFLVSDAGYFTDGWGIKGVQGDEIQLYETSQKAKIISVSYSTGIITLDRKVNWKQGQGVSLSYNNTAPDVGAYELE